MFTQFFKKNKKDIFDPRNDPFGKFNGNEIVYVSQALDSENHSARKPFTIQLEDAFKERFGMKYAISQNSGTSTLHTCLADAGVGASIASGNHTCAKNCAAFIPPDNTKQVEKNVKKCKAVVPKNK